MIKPLIIVLAIILLLPNIPGISFADSPNSFNGKEKYSPQLSFIHSVNQLEKLVDAAAKDKNIPFQSLEYAELLDNTIAYRFYDSYSRKTLQQDWITVISDEFLGTNLSFITSPDEIMQHPNAASIQQNIVMMEILKRKNINFRNIEINEHHAIEIQIAGNWYFFDVSKEPNLEGNERISGNKGIYAMNLTGYYGPKVEVESKGKTPQSSVHIQRGDINDPPVFGMNLLQIFTGFFSKTAWILCLLLLWVVRKHSFKMYAIKPKGKYIYMYPGQPVFNA
jgi:phosphatidylglycerophosphatase A